MRRIGPRRKPNASSGENIRREKKAVPAGVSIAEAVAAYDSASGGSKDKLAETPTALQSVGGLFFIAAVPSFGLSREGLAAAQPHIPRLWSSFAYMAFPYSFSVCRGRGDLAVLSYFLDIRTARRRRRVPLSFYLPFTILAPAALACSSFSGNTELCRSAFASGSNIVQSYLE